MMPSYFLLRRVCVFVAAAIFFQSILLPLVEATPSKDEAFGAWNQYEIEKKIDSRWKIKLGEDLRFRSHQGLYYEETRVGANFQAYRWLGLGAEYLEARSTRAVGKKDVWYWDSTPRFYITPSQSWKGFQLEDRNMLEIRFKQHIRDTVRYRNMVTLTAPWKWTPLEFQPYTANEIFIESDRNGMIEDRFYSGFKIHWWGPVYGSLYYLRNSTKNAVAKWKALNILGVGFKLSI